MWEVKREEGRIRGGGRHNLREVERRDRLLFRSGGCNGWIRRQSRSEGGANRSQVAEWAVVRSTVGTLGRRLAQLAVVTASAATLAPAAALTDPQFWSGV